MEVKNTIKTKNKGSKNNNKNKNKGSLRERQFQPDRHPQKKPPSLQGKGGAHAREPANEGAI